MPQFVQLTVTVLMCSKNLCPERLGLGLQFSDAALLCGKAHSPRGGLTCPPPGRDELYQGPGPALGTVKLPDTPGHSGQRLKLGTTGPGSPSDKAALAGADLAGATRLPCTPGAPRQVWAQLGASPANLGTGPGLVGSGVPGGRAARQGRGQTLHPAMSLTADSAPGTLPMSLEGISHPGARRWHV